MASDVPAGHVNTVQNKYIIKVRQAGLTPVIYAHTRVQDENKFVCSTLSPLPRGL